MYNSKMTQTYTLLTGLVQFLEKIVNSSELTYMLWEALMHLNYGNNGYLLFHTSSSS